MENVVYVFGAGASLDYGAPLTKNILPFALKLKKALENHIRMKGLPKPDEIPPFGSSYLNRLGNKELTILEHVFCFISDFFHGGKLHEDNLPTLEEVFSILYLLQNENTEYNNFNIDETYRNLKASMYFVLRYCTQINDDVEFSPSLEKFSPNPFEIFFAKRLKPLDTVITTNYDTFAEDALRSLYKNKIDFGSEVSSYQIIPGGFKKDVNHENKANITLLKLHGSLNWLLCPKCGELSDFPFQNMAVVADTQHYQIYDRKYLSCPKDGSPRESLVVVPSLIRQYANQHLQNIWQVAERKIIRATDLYFIGYSMPEADIHVKYLFKKSLWKNKKFKRKQLKIKVIDPCVSTAKNYQRLFGRDNVKHIQCGFRYFIEEDKDRTTGNE